MIIHRQSFPWLVLVLTASGTGWTQASNLPAAPASQSLSRPAATANGPDMSIASAAREGRSIALSSDGHLRGGAVPEFHTVDRGDTLWEITGYYFDNPWRWPALWALNPQITNPHWIFPRDQVRLIPEGSRPAVAPSVNRGIQAPSRVPAGTIFMNDQGYLDAREAENAGTIAGSPQDHMILTEGDRAYVDFPRRTPVVGEQVTIYQDAQRAQGSDRDSGHVVRIIGTAQIESWNAQRHIATVRITESIDTIERGERVATVPRRFQIVPPRRNAQETNGHIVATVNPRDLVAGQMVVFLDRGSEDNVEQGNRFQVVRRGDAWRDSLTIRADQATGTGIDRDGDGIVDDPPNRITADSNMPEEVVGELTVVDVRARSSTAIVTSSVVDLRRGDRWVGRRGY